MSKDLENLWSDDTEPSGTYFSANEKSPDYEKAVNDLHKEVVDVEWFSSSEEDEKPLTEKEIQAQRRAMRFK